MEASLQGLVSDPPWGWMLAALGLAVAAGAALAGRRLSENRALAAKIRARALALEAATRAQREQERVFASVLRGMSDAVVVVAPDGSLPLVNPAFERLAGKPIDAGGWTAELPLAEHIPFERALQGETVAVDGVLRRDEEDSEGTHLEGSVRPIRDLGGEVRGAVAIVRDVTAGRRAEARRAQLIADLDRRNAGLERFAEAVSVDLADALGRVSEAVADLEQSTAAGDLERAEAHADRVGRATAEMKLRLDELLELSRALQRAE